MDAFGVTKRYSAGKLAALESAASKHIGYRSFITRKGKATLRAKRYAQAELGARASQPEHFREAGTLLRRMARQEAR